MAKQTKSMSEIIESYRPKYFKHVIIPTDETLKQLKDESFDLSSLDTIHNDGLVEQATKAKYYEFERDIIKHAKEPTRLEDGIVLSRRMVTKTDKSLAAVGIGRFTYNDVNYVSIRLRYDAFHIIEIFILQ